jgi:hypothetical protein
MRPVHHTDAMRPFPGPFWDAKAAPGAPGEATVDSDDEEFGPFPRS